VTPPKTTTKRPVGVCPQHGTEHGHLVPREGACCRDCGSLWYGALAAHCASCHATFSGVTAFDAHMFSLGCRPPDSIRTDLIEVDGYWRMQKDEGAA